MSRIEAIPLALDMFVSFDQFDNGANLGLDLKVRFEGGEFYLDEAIVTEPIRNTKDAAPRWLLRLIEEHADVRAAAERAWHEHEVRLSDDAADDRREDRRLSA